MRRDTTSDPGRVGGYAYVPPRTVHASSNETDAPAKYLLIASPAGLENYSVELAELVKDEPSWPPKDMSKVLVLMAKYDIFPPQVLYRGYPNNLEVNHVVRRTAQDQT